MSIFIEDGYTKRKTIEAVEGIHPEVTVEFRPALPKKRLEYSALLNAGAVDRQFDFETDLILKHLVSLDADPSPFGDPKSAQAKDRVGRVIPSLRGKLIDAVLGYTPSQDAADQKNLPSG